MFVPRLGCVIEVFQLRYPAYQVSPVCIFTILTYSAFVGLDSLEAVEPRLRSAGCFCYHICYCPFLCGLLISVVLDLWQWCAL